MSIRVDRRTLAMTAAVGVGASMIAGKDVVAQDASPAASPATESPLAAIGKVEDLIEHGTTTYESPLSTFSEFITPNDQAFVRSNGPVTVDIDAAEWRLEITGLVDTPLELSLEDLKAMETTTVTSWLECSGNSRSRWGDDPKMVEGTQWGNGAIFNVEWTGVPLSTILEQAGVQEGAVDVVSFGGDFEDMQRGLPLETAQNGEVMIAWQMNGEDIPATNGGPVRLVVPRWGGIASTKWVVKLELIDKEFDGSFNTKSYVIIDENEEVIRPVREMPVKSFITSVEPGGSVSAGTNTIEGLAWSGMGAVTGVEVSVDNGETWEAAELTEEAGELSWYRFEFEWEAEAGDTVLLSRATDATGDVQADSVDDLMWNAKGYQMNAVYPVEVTVS